MVYLSPSPSMPTSVDPANARDRIAPATLESAFTLPAFNTIFLDTNALACFARFKAIWIVVTTGLTWVTSGQATAQPFASRTAFAAAGGATSQLGLPQIPLNSPVNFGGAAATSIAINTVARIGVTQASELGNYDPLIGLELKFPSALTAGAISIFLEQCGG